ncbi:MAG: CBS domain-containing protein [Candidatus Aminicenantes bacterium]|nr:CBS domain-containing protein [Candidatus Aminicenantes bacterium]
MRHSWRIAKVFGIDIKIDSSWIIIFVLFSWILSANYFPQRYQDWSRGLYWIIGIITSLLIFASVLVHELAHSLVALKQGEKVRSITLFLLGGVAQITEEPKRPLREFTMALVGPMASLLIAFLFLILSFILRGISEPLLASASYLAMINTVLAIFNLFPGFPMDGGRVLRSIIWKVTGNLKKATKIASRVGQGFAFFLIFIGILQILRANLLPGIWMIFIGWFLHSAAVRGYDQVMVQSLLKGVRAEDLMTKNFEAVTPDLSVQSLVDDYILKKRERVFLVSDKGSLKGIVCLEDVKQTPSDKWPETKVGEIMTPKEKLEAVSPNADGSQVLNSITTKDIHQIPVMEGDKIAGIICRSDILRFIQFRSELGV